MLKKPTRLESAIWFRAAFIMPLNVLLLFNFLLVVSPMFVSCNHIFMDEQKANTTQNNFDILWQIFDERYCFFEEKNVNWNELYHTYDLYVKKYCDKDPSSQCLFNSMSQMLSQLCDGHVSLSDGVQTNTYTGWCDPYPANFDEGLIMSLYLQQERTKKLNNGTSITSLSESIGYIYCPSFLEKFNQNELDKALVDFWGYKGIIIDIRNNGGGLVSEAYVFASRFVNEKKHIGYIRYKTGKKHDDFSDYFRNYIEPEGPNPFQGKIVVITNRRVYSAANLFVSIMKDLPQVCVMGDLTGGGGGVPISAELYNGWKVELSTNPFFDINKKSIESGIEPHQKIMLDSTNDKDNIIETAKKWILKN